MASINRLTVDGKDYFLPDPVDGLREQILEAIRLNGGYVNIPPLRSGPGIDILFSPGTAVTWTRIDIGGEEPESDDEEPLGDL
ncbi:hypothetical protein [Microbacterium terricola]|uniref:Uncharacterized protein n=1 Tax=Microbacterium terricola TaxID=344163 RepID=A0ABM8DVD1_9MICO|nr:hypothetical protein [Microbacterium terricola]UYK39665.1 hypothetical protein OAU46_13320 [Microbacterium terricola]BDV29593.1 hypothetical protein Microterr_02530 [Microbacterium terricola]